MKDINTMIFLPSDPNRCDGCMYNTYLGCTAPQSFYDSCPNKGGKS